MLVLSQQDAGLQVLHYTAESELQNLLPSLLSYQARARFIMSLFATEYFPSLLHRILHTAGIQKAFVAVDYDADSCPGFLYM